MPETISNVNNKYLLAKETSYGEIPGSFTQLDFGYVQSISVDEDDSTEEVSAVNTGHTLATLDDDIYNVSGSITTKISQPSLPNLLEALGGDLDTDTPTAGKYTMTTSPVTSESLSYFMKFNNLTGKTMQLVGICFVGGEITVNRDGSVEMTLNYQAQKLSPATESISPDTAVGTLFRGLDALVTYGGNNTRLNSFSLSLDWGFDIADSRSIESVDAADRRLIQRIIRNELSLTGSFESELDANIDTGYVANRSTVAIVLTLSRGVGNVHTFTIATSLVNTRSRELSTGGGKKLISGDFIGVDLGVVGDIYDDES